MIHRCKGFLECKHVVVVFVLVADLVGMQTDTCTSSKRGDRPVAPFGEKTPHAHVLIGRRLGAIKSKREWVIVNMCVSETGPSEDDSSDCVVVVR